MTDMCPGPRGGETKRQIWSVLVWLLYVCVCLCVGQDNGIIEVLGVTGALMPGPLDCGQRRHVGPGSGDWRVPFRQ